MPGGIWSADVALMWSHREMRDDDNTALRAALTRYSAVGSR